MVQSLIEGRSSTGGAFLDSFERRRARAPRFARGVTVLLLLTLAGCVRARPEVPVVLVSIDTLRPDHLGCYGYTRPTSPNLDAFRKDAVLFSQAFAHAPSTLASHAAILASLLPPHHGASIANDLALPREILTLTEVLRDAGYATASWNGGIQLDPAWGLDQGFDVYASVKPRGAPAESLIEKTDRFAHQVERAAGWIRSRPGPGFFLFLHTYEVHHPYSPDRSDLDVFRGGYDGPLPDLVTVELLQEVNGGKRPADDRDRQHIVDTYDAEILSMDRAFGALVALLKEGGFYDEALVIVTSDHGEEFGEHGLVGWHSHSLYDELLRVPLLVKLPKSRRAGATIADPARGIDVAPTAITALRLPLPPAFEGRNLLSEGPLSAEAAEVWSSRDVTTPNVVWALRTPEWKLYDQRLFDLGKDAAERVDVANAEPDVVRRLADRRRALRDARPRPKPRPALADDELRERLRALGYVE